MWQNGGWRAVVDALAHRAHLPSILQDRICEWYERELFHLVKLDEEKESDAT